MGCLVWFFLLNVHLAETLKLMRKTDVYVNIGHLAWINIIIDFLTLPRTGKLNRLACVANIICVVQCALTVQENVHKMFTCFIVLTTCRVNYRIKSLQ